MNSTRPTRTYSQMIWVSLGRVGLVGTWFAATILIMRVLGVAGLGLYGYCQAAIKIATGCVGDPLDMAVMRRGPLLLKDDRAAALHLVRSAFYLRLMLGVLILLAVLAVPAFASQKLFGHPEYRLLTVLTAAGVLGDFLLRSVLGFFQIGEQFGKFIAVDSAWQGGRVAAVIGLYLLHQLTPVTAIGLYVVAPYVAFAVGLILLPSDVRQITPPHRRDMFDILHYSKWMMGGLAMAAIYERLDILLLRHFHGDYAVGVYMAALFWAVIPDFINGIVQTIVAPKIAPAYAAGTFNALQLWYLRLAVPAGALFLAIALPIAGWVIRTFTSGEFAASTNVYRILIVSTVFNSVFTPLPEALVNFVAPKRATLYSAVGLGWVAIGGVLFIPWYGAIGAAGVMLAARAIVGSITIVTAQLLSKPATAPRRL